MDDHPRRGDVFFAFLDPVLGCEQGGTRPVLVVQNDAGNRRSKTIIVAAITGKPKGEPPRARTRARVGPGSGRARSPSWSSCAPSTSCACAGGRGTSAPSR